MRTFILVALFFICGAEPSHGFEFVTSRGSGLGQTVALSSASASGVLRVPSIGLSGANVKVEAGFRRSFEMKELDEGYLAAAFRKGKFTYLAGFTQFGDGDLYAESTARVSVTYHHDSLSVGANASAMQVDFGGHYESLSAEGLGLGVSYRAGSIQAAIVAENVNSPRLDSHSERFEPRYTLYTELVGPGPYSITGKVTLQEREKPQFGVGQIVEISGAGSLFWGLSTAPIIYGGGLEISYKNSLITYAASYHPTLGFSHTLSAGFTLGKAGD